MDSTSRFPWSRVSIIAPAFLSAFSQALTRALSLCSSSVLYGPTTTARLRDLSTIPGIQTNLRAPLRQLRGINQALNRQLLFLCVTTPTLEHKSYRKSDSALWQPSGTNENIGGKENKWKL